MSNEERALEAVAMNIVHQIGDALYDALPKDIAHNHFVVARQKTNDVLIDFAKELIKAHTAKIVEEKESTMAVLVYRAIKHRIAMKQDISGFIDDQEKWHLERLKQYTGEKES